jgi:hypothetical protein
MTKGSSQGQQEALQVPPANTEGLSVVGNTTAVGA